MPITINIDAFSETLTKCNDENKVQYSGRYHLRRATFFAVIVPPIREGDFQYRSLSDVQQAALDSQGGGQMHQMNGVEVLHNLMKISRTLLPRQDQEEFVIQTIHSVIPQHLALPHTHSNYYQFCYRTVQLVNHHNGVCFGYHSSRSIEPPHTGRLATWQMAQLVCDQPVAAFGVHWLVQLDFVDLHKPYCMCLGNVGRRWWELTAGTSSVRSNRNQNRKYHGVRYRLERDMRGHKSWFAEMKPSKRQKITFGSFKLQVEAARAVDAAYHYYDKPKCLNFQDSPKFLPPLSAEGLTDEKAKLAFVKFQAKRLAERALVSPSMEPANRTLSGIGSLEIRPEEIFGQSSSAPVVQAGSWSSEDGVDKGSNTEPTTHNGVAAILSNLQSEYVTNVQPCLEDFAEEISLEANSAGNHARLTQQDNFISQITGEAEFAMTNESDIPMGTQVHAFTSLNRMLHDVNDHTPDELDILIGHLYFTNTEPG